MKPYFAYTRLIFTHVVFVTAIAMTVTLHAGNNSIIEALREAADSLHSAGRTDSAAIVGQRVIELSEKEGNPTLIVGAHSSQGVYLRSLGRVDEALESYEKALEIVMSGALRDTHDQEAIEEIASLYINLAVLNLDMQQKEDAARNAIKSAEWIFRSEDSGLKSMIFGVAGSVLTGCGDLANAMKYQGLAYSNAIESGNDEAAFRAAAYAMLAADRSGDKGAAQGWREKCSSLLSNGQPPMALLVYYQAECSICMRNNDYRGSVAWFEKILNLDGIDNLPFVRLDCYGNLHDAYARLGEYKPAYETVMKAYELRNELWEQEKTQSLQELMVKYDAKEKELALAHSEAARANTLMWLFAVLGLLMAGTIVSVVYASRQKRHSMRQYIKGMENERCRMAAELHDGVCNDLLAIQMKMLHGGSEETAAGMIDNCRETVRRISHELMPPEFTYADINEVIGYFVNKQRDAYMGKIEFEYVAESSDSRWSDIDDSISLEIYRIVQEAVGNAVKHSGASQIAVSLTLKAKELMVSVTDNGTYKFTEKKGRGEDSMRRRASAIGGNIEIRTDNGTGTQVKLSIKAE